jgi:pSer/pThr/pTyr-binding forkhead associated (FHA) protein
VSFIIQRIRGTQVTLGELRRRTLRIGRGTNAQIRSDNAAVALEHAVVEEVAAGYELLDRGSITGTYLNGRPVESSRLAARDTIEIGDLRIIVQVADAGKPLFLRVETVESDDADGAYVTTRTTRGATAAGPKGGAVVAPRVDYAAAYRLRRRLLSKRVLSILALAIALAGVTAVVAGNRQRAYMPGALSIAHSSAMRPDGTRVIGDNDCGACHAPFGGAIDEKCLSCHQKAFHQSTSADPGPCVQCHAEHRQIPNLAAVHHQECISCHRDLSATGAQLTVASSITSFGEDHPDFAITLPGSSQRVPVTSPEAAAADPTTLKFDHHCHLNGPCNFRPPSAADPRRVKQELNCESCHAIEPQSGRFLPVRYETTCATCHLLTFDNRFPPVPHGINLETVAGVIANAYAGNRDLLTQSPEEVLRTFAQQRGRTLDIGSATVRNAQQVVKVRCQQCHELTADRMAVVPPVQGHHWLKGVRSFSHLTHMSESMRLDCVSCHATITTSRRGSTLSLPSRENCVSCHRSAGDHAGRGLDRCTTCHYYHELTTRSGPGWTARTASVAAQGAASVPSGGGIGFEQFAALLTVKSMITFVLAILLILALIAIVALIAVSRANRKAAARRSASAGARPTPQAAPPPRPAPPAPRPTPPAAEPRPTPSAAPAPPAPPPPPADATVMMEVPPPGAAAAPMEGTQMIQWFGSLVGVSGPFAGKRIPIDPEGFYIGRDKEMSSIVIDDSKISRRHVWVGVRDGQVTAIEQESTNGTFLNSVDSPRITRVVLKAGDLLILASEVASFRYEP